MNFACLYCRLPNAPTIAIKRKDSSEERCKRCGARFYQDSFRKGMRTGRTVSEIRFEEGRT